MPTLHLTHEELEAVFFVVNEESRDCYEYPDLDRGLLLLGVQTKCFHALKAKPAEPDVIDWKEVSKIIFEKHIKDAEQAKAEADEMDYKQHLEQLRSGLPL
jgi:hypothetical protein